MNRIWGYCALLIAGLLVIAGVIHATLIGVSPDFPIIVYDNQGTTRYDAGSGLFSIDASPISIRPSPQQPPSSVDPTGDPPDKILSILVILDINGDLLGGV